MANFFAELVSQELIKDWAETLDWLVDDNKFDKQYWSRGYVGSFTKKIKRLDNIGHQNYFYNSRENLDFTIPERLNKPLIISAKGDGEGRDFVRHIRNGIAHGNTDFKKVKGILYIEIIDYNASKEQTAYIFFPITYITEIHKKYKDVEKSRENNRAKNKSTTKMKGRKSK